MSLGERLRKLRKEKGISQIELAKKFEATSQAISQYELEKRSPDLKTASKIANYFNVSVDYLIGNTDESRSIEKIKEALVEDPELLKLCKELSDRKELQLILKQIKNLKPSTINQINAIINILSGKQ